MNTTFGSLCDRSIEGVERTVYIYIERRKVGDEGMLSFAARARRGWTRVWGRRWMVHRTRDGVHRKPTFS